MPIAVLFPRKEYASIAERYASWRTQAELRRAGNVEEVVYYDEDEPARGVVEHVGTAQVLVILDPLAPDRQYVCETAALRGEKRSLARALEGRAATTEIALRTWRPAPPPDLLPFIPADARSILHVGCGDGSLGARVKERQRCRVVGIANERTDALVARRRLDDVYTGDLAELVAILDERFDCVVVAGVLEHMIDPWSFVADLRRIAGTLIAGIHTGAPETPAAQVRFFTRDTIEELIDIAGWTLERIEPAAPASFVAVAASAG